MGFQMFDRAHSAINHVHLFVVYIFFPIALGVLPPNVVGFFLRVFQKLNEIFVVLAVAYAKFVVNVFFSVFG